MNTNKSDDISLPEGWEAHRDEYGRRYYFHPRTDESIWTRPLQVSVDSGGKVFSMVIKNETDRQQFFAGIYRELKASLLFVNRKSPWRRVDSKREIPSKPSIPSMSEIYKQAKREAVHPKDFVTFISTALGLTLNEDNNTSIHSQSPPPKLILTDGQSPKYNSSKQRITTRTPSSARLSQGSRSARRSDPNITRRSEISHARTATPVRDSKLKRLHRERLRLSLKDDDNLILDSLLEKEHLLEETHGKIVKLQREIAQKQENIQSLKSKVEQEKNLKSAAMEEANDLRDALKLSERQRVVAEEGRDELMKHLESVFGEQRNELLSSASDLKTAWMARDLAKRELKRTSESLHAARALAKNLRLQLNEVETSKARLKETATLMHTNMKETHVVLRESKDQIASLEATNERMKKDLGMLRQNRERVSTKHAADLRAHQDKLLQIKDELKKALQELELEKAKNARSAAAKDGKNDQHQREQQDLHHLVGDLRSSLRMKDQEYREALARIEALTTKVLAAEKAQKAMKRLRAREATLKGELRAVAKARSKERQQKDDVRAILERQISDLKKHLERERSRFKRDLALAKRVHATESENLVHRAGEIEAGRQQSMTSLHHAKMLLAEERSRVQTLEDALAAQEGRNVSAGQRRQEREAMFLQAMGSLTDAAPNVKNQESRSQKEDGKASPVEVVRREMIQHFTRLKDMWEDERQEELELTIERAREDRKRAIESVQRRAEMELKQLRTEMNIKVEQERIEGQRRVREAHASTERLKEQSRLEVELAVERTKAELTSTWRNGEREQEASHFTSLQEKDKRIDQLERELKSAVEEAKNTGREESKVAFTQRLQRVVAKRETDHMRLRRAESLKRLRDYATRFDKLVLARAFRQWMVFDAKAFVHDVADGSFIYARKLDALQRLMLQHQMQRRRRSHRAFLRWKLFSTEKSYRIIVTHILAAARLWMCLERQGLRSLGLALSRWKRGTQYRSASTLTRHTEEKVTVAHPNQAFPLPLSAAISFPSSSSSSNSTTPDNTADNYHHLREQIKILRRENHRSEMETIRAKRRVAELKRKLLRKAL